MFKTFLKYLLPKYSQSLRLLELVIYMEFKGRFDKENDFDIYLKNNHALENFVLENTYAFDLKCYLDTLKTIVNPSKVLLFLCFKGLMCTSVIELEPREFIRTFSIEAILSYIVHCMELDRWKQCCSFKAINSFTSQVIYIKY